MMRQLIGIYYGAGEFYGSSRCSGDHLWKAMAYTYWPGYALWVVKLGMWTVAYYESECYEPTFGTSIGQ